MTQSVIPESEPGLKRLVRPVISNLPSYVPGKGAAKKVDGLVRLDMNESPYGPSPRTRAALMDFVSTNRYPDFAQTPLRRALSDYSGIPFEQIVCGAGLDDVFATLAMLLIEPGDQVIISEPTFGVYRPLFSTHGADVVNAPLTADFALQPDVVLDALTDRTKLIIICSPNNPTGNVFPLRDIRAICSGANCLVAIDEAYVEFSGQSHIPLMDEFPNVMILRTMSKWAGLAGMRVGYGLVPEQLVDTVGHVVPPFHNVALASSEAAVASIDDREFLLEQVQRICDDRDDLFRELVAIDQIEPLPSVTNFILIRTRLDDARPLVDAIAERGVLVRGYGDEVLRRYLRVSVGSAGDNQLFLNALTDALRDMR